MMPGSQQWYVVRTHPHAEHKAAAHLQRQRFEVYLPCYAKRRRHARCTDVIAAPLFPRYLFVSIDLVNQRWQAIRSTLGVIELVCRSGVPVSVTSEIVRCLKKRENAAGLVQLAAAPLFSAGDAVRIVGGTFSEYLGLFEAMTDNERVSVLLDLLGRKVRVVMSIDSIEAA